MSRKAKLATLFLVAAVGLGIYFLFQDAPAETTITYDLGDEHQTVVRLEVWFSLEGEMARHVQWFFEPGEAPRRVTHSPTLPAGDVLVRLEIENDAGEVLRDRRQIEPDLPGDPVFFLETP